MLQVKMASSSLIALVIRDCYIELVEKLIPVGLVEYLAMKRFISQDSRTAINKVPTHFEKNIRLISCLLTKDDSILDEIIIYLRGPAGGQESMADLLQQAKEKHTTLNEKPDFKLTETCIDLIASHLVKSFNVNENWVAICRDDLHMPSASVLDIYEMIKEQPSTNKISIIKDSLCIWIRQRQKVGEGALFMRLVEIIKKYDLDSAKMLESDKENIKAAVANQK